MSKRLIINADDFGLCRAQNYGIVEAFEHGVVSSTSAIVTSPAIEHAAWLAERGAAVLGQPAMALSLPKLGLVSPGRCCRWPLLRP